MAFLSHFVITPIHNSTHAVTSDAHNRSDDGKGGIVNGGDDEMGEEGQHGRSDAAT